MSESDTPIPGTRQFLRAKRVLFIRLRSLGDVVLMTPALRVAKKAGARVGVVVESPFHQILDGNPDVDQVLVPSGRGKWASRIQVLREIRRFAPDLVIDLHGGSTSSFLTRFSAASERVGYAQSSHSRFYTRCVPDSHEIWGKKRLHTVEHQLSPLKHLGWPVEPIPPLRVQVSPTAMQNVRQLLSNRGLSQDFILLHPAAAFETKQWPITNFIDIARSLVDRGHKVVTTSGPGQEDLLSEIADCNCTGIDVLQPLSLPEFVALASLCKLYIGNDTGPTHIAAALKKRIVVMFGSSDAEVWFPWQTRYRLLRSDLGCIPCPGYTCLHYDIPRCIHSIPVSSVLRESLELLSVDNEEQLAL